MQKDIYPVSDDLSDYVDSLLEGRIIEEEVSDESLFDVFPAQAFYLGRNKKTTVSVDIDTVGSLEQSFSTRGLDCVDLRQIYVMTGVIRAMLHSVVSPGNPEQVDNVHKAFSSTDGLLTSILESDIEEESADYLLLAIREGWVDPDLAGINSSRFALSLLYNSKKYGVLDTMQRFSEVSMQQLEDSLGHRRNDFYLFSEKMGVPLEAAAIQFAEEIPHINIIGSFPTAQDESERLLAVLE